jgi:uncharacterized Zn-finger protein
MNEDMVYVNTYRVKCEGQGKGMGHPRIYLEIKSVQIECPYCSKIFRLKENANH